MFQQEMKRAWYVNNNSSKEMSSAGGFVPSEIQESIAQIIFFETQWVSPWKPCLQHSLPLQHTGILQTYPPTASHLNASKSSTG